MSIDQPVLLEHLMRSNNIGFTDATSALKANVYNLPSDPLDYYKLSNLQQHKLRDFKEQQQQKQNYLNYLISNGLVENEKFPQYKLAEMTTQAITSTVTTTTTTTITENNFSNFNVSSILGFKDISKFFYDYFTKMFGPKEVAIAFFSILSIITILMFCCLIYCYCCCCSKKSCFSKLFCCCGGCSCLRKTKKKKKKIDDDKKKIFCFA